MSSYSNEYPIYIVSKGRADVSYTARMFDADNVDYKILIESQEYDDYAKYTDKDKLVKLPFSNLGVGSYPARNYAKELSLKENATAHWVFDDNIRGACKFVKGAKVPCSSALAIDRAEKLYNKYSNVDILAFNYRYFVATDARKPFYVNVHCYSCMLIDNSADIKWRLKYNEDVDLCLQTLSAGRCTILLNAYCMNKTSTSAKMRGGNQTELYLNNDPKKKIEKAVTLKKEWPQYVELKMRYNRPHHYVDWKKHFNNKLISKETAENVKR
jgi:hypothetical protein